MVSASPTFSIYKILFSGDTADDNAANDNSPANNSSSANDNLNSPANDNPPANNILPQTSDNPLALTPAGGG